MCCVCVYVFMCVCVCASSPPVASDCVLEEEAEGQVVERRVIYDLDEARDPVVGSARTHGQGLGLRVEGLGLRVEG